MPRHTWTAEQTALLVHHYPHQPTAELAARLGCSVPALYNKATSLGLKKSAAALARETPHKILRANTHPRIVASQFKPGQPAWNKGMKGLDIGGKATRFKPGQRPHTAQPIGSYRLNKDGHLQQKVSDTPGNNSKRWRSVAEVVWCAAHGPLPKGHMVVFKPGRFTNHLPDITVDAVECITLAQNMARNSRHRLPPEVNQLVAIKGAITRQVNRITREAQERNATP